MILRLSIVGLLFALLLGGLAYFQLVFKPQMIKGFIANAPRPPVAVTTTRAQKEQWIPRLPSVGTLTAIQGIDVSSQVGGIVSAIQHDSGEDVTEGTHLIDLDTSVEVADVATAKANLRLAELSFKRATDLAQRSVDPVATVDQARATRDAADASEKRAEAVAGQKTILAPFAGRLGIRKVDKGQYVSPGMALVSLQQLDPMRVDFPLPQQDYANLKVGQPVEVSVDAWPAQTFAGKVVALDARVASDTRTLLVRANIPNPDHKLLPGMFADVTVFVGEPKDVVTVPRTAITYSLYGDAVWVVQNHDGSSDTKQDGTNAAAPAAGPGPSPAADRRTVKVGETRGDRVSVTDGLAAGDEVVTTGQIKLTPGAQIRAKNAETLQPPAVLPKQ